MDHDTDKIDETVLALLWLTIHEDGEFGGAWTWKSHDWDALSRLREQGLISDPRSKAKSVLLTPQGLDKSEELFERMFAKND